MFLRWNEMARIYGKGRCMIFLAALASAFSCNSTSEKSKQLENDSLITTDTFIRTTKTDSIVHKEKIGSEPKVFISIYPGAKWIDSMQVLQGEEDWNEVVFDNQHFIHEAQTYLESKGYVEIEQPEGRIWKIKRPNCIVKTIDSDTLADKWGTLIFNWHEDPVFYSGTEPATELKDF